jgi:predicted RNA-binding protein (virulence factor B family)
MPLQDLLGKQVNLNISRFTDNGLYLCPTNTDKAAPTNDFVEILLPRRELHPSMKIGDELSVFVYADSEDRPVATLQKPLLKTGEMAYLQVIAVNRIGGFFDWGLPKDLFVPFSEQNARLEIGKKYMIYAYLDVATNRIVGTMNLNKFIKNNEISVAESEKVQLTIVEFHELGARVSVNNKHWGMVYGNQIFQTLRIGQTLSGYVLKVREDGKLDIGLQPAGYDASIDLMVERVVSVLKRCGGFLPLNDNSPPEEIYAMLQMSKKQFKKAVGALFRQKLIVLEHNGIRQL